MLSLVIKKSTILMMTASMSSTRFFSAEFFACNSCSKFSRSISFIFTRIRYFSELFKEHDGEWSICDLKESFDISDTLMSIDELQLIWLISYKNNSLFLIFFLFKGILKFRKSKKLILNFFLRALIFDLLVITTSFLKKKKKFKTFKLLLNFKVLKRIRKNKIN